MITQMTMVCSVSGNNALCWHARALLTGGRDMAPSKELLPDKPVGGVSETYPGEGRWTMQMTWVVQTGQMTRADQAVQVAKAEQAM